jgi:hypothetical protein
MADDTRLAEKIDALAATMLERFDAVDRRFDAVDRRFDAVDDRLDGVDRRFAAMDDRFDSMEVRSDDLKSHLWVAIEALDSKVQLALEKLDHLIDRDTINTGDHARIDQRLEHHDARILALESRKGRPRAR